MQHSRGDDRRFAKMAIGAVIFAAVIANPNAMACAVSGHSRSRRAVPHTGLVMRVREHTKGQCVRQVWSVPGFLAVEGNRDGAASTSKVLPVQTCGFRSWGASCNSDISAQHSTGGVWRAVTRRWLGVDRTAAKTAARQWLGAANLCPDTVQAHRPAETRTFAPLLGPPASGLSVEREGWLGTDCGRICLHD